MDRLSALFGDDGLVLTPLSQGSVDTGRDVAIDGSGRIVVSGYSNATGSGYNVLAVTRYLDNGDLDASFDTDGKAYVDLRDVPGAGGPRLCRPAGRVAVPAAVAGDGEQSASRRGSFSRA